MTVDDLLDGQFMDGSSSEGENDLDQVGPEILHLVRDEFDRDLGHDWAGIG